jgi:hypothetical protein
VVASTKSEVPKNANAAAPIVQSKRIVGRRTAVMVIAIAMTIHNPAST